MTEENGDHQQLMGQLTNCNNNFILTLAGLTLISDPAGKTILKNANCIFGEYKLKFDQIIPLVDNKDDFEIAFRETVLMAFRALLKESFELIRNYADRTGQSDRFRAFESYNIHRLVRHAISHDFRWSLKTNRGNYYEFLPHTWHGITIDQTMDGKFVVLEQFPFAAFWRLFVDTRKSAEDNLDLKFVRSDHFLCLHLRRQEQ